MRSVPNRISDLQNTLEKIRDLKILHPNNLGLQCFDFDYFNSLEPDHQERLLQCLRSGIEIPKSETGCYANFGDDYNQLRPYFAKLIAAYHKVPENTHHRSDWNFPDHQTQTGLNTQTLGLSAPPSARVRVARNVVGHPLTAAMTRQDRTDFENEMVEKFGHLSALDGFGGTYYSLTPGHPQQISEGKYQELISDHLMFKSMEHDPFLTTAGIAADWPHGRGCYISEDQGFIVWIGEEDHLRIMAMAETHDLGHVFGRLKNAVDMFQTLGVEFATSEEFGNLTSCPTNLGTGMRASVHMQLPNLIKQHSEDELKQIAGNLGLGIRGMGGEHTPYGEDGTVDISPKARFGVTEAQIMETLYEGITALKSLEDESAAQV